MQAENSYAHLLPQFWRGKTCRVCGSVAVTSAAQNVIHDAAPGADFLNPIVDGAPFYGCDKHTAEGVVSD